MARHDIRIRRGQFGANRIQRHKDYSQLLNKHRKTNRLRSVIYLILLVVVILLVIGLGYFSITNQQDKPDKTKQPTSLVVEMNSEKTVHQ